MNDFKRREFIKLSALGFAGIALQLNSISAYAQKANAHLGKWNANTELNWDAFLEKLSQIAKTQHEFPWDQNVYTQQVKQLLLQCNFPEFEKVRKAMDSYENRNPNMFEATGLHKEIDFQVGLFQFEKGEYISHHDHPDMTGVINVVSGNALAKNYSIEELLPETREVVSNGRKEIMQKVTIRETSNTNVSRGDVSILTADEGNIHSIMPNDFTQLIDVFTPAYGRDTKTIWYTVNEDDYYEGREKIFEAEYAKEGLSQVDTILLGTDVLSRYVGLYKINDESFIKIELSGQNLILERTKSLEGSGRRMNLLPYEQSKFWIEGQEVRCEFEMKGENNPAGLSIHFKGSNISATKIK
ncbi:MAG: hypothetical protein NXI09_09685 [Bacteroidetes bacterium]|nr:hypothetical protein [Bacteroidota bacterium]